ELARDRGDEAAEGFVREDGGDRGDDELRIDQLAEGLREDVVVACLERADEVAARALVDHPFGQERDVARAESGDGRGREGQVAHSVRTESTKSACRKDAAPLALPRTRCYGGGRCRDRRLPPHGSWRNRSSGPRSASSRSG